MKRMTGKLRIIDIRIPLLITLAVLCSVRIVWGQYDKRQLPYILEPIEATPTSSYQKILIDDLDNDGHAEMVDLSIGSSISNYYHVHYHDGDLNSVSWQKNYVVDDAYALHAMDIVGNRNKEIFVSLRRGGEIVVSIYSLKGDLISSFKTGHGEDLNGDDFIDIGITLHAAADLNGDGEKEAIFAHTAGHDLSPRGVLAYDIHADKPLWYYPTAGPPSYVKVFYPNDRSLPFLAVVTSSPSNGNVVNGMNDSQTYLLLLSSEGKLLHTEILGERFTQGSLNIVDYDNDGQTEIITSLGSSSTNPKIRTNITAWRFDPEKEQLYSDLRRDFVIPLREGILVDDINRDGSVDFLIQQRSWSLSILDAHFNTTATWASINEVIPYFIADLNGDGRKEIYVRSTVDKRTLVFDEQLTVISEFSDAGKLFLFHIGAGRNPLLALKGETTLYLLELVKAPLLTTLPISQFWRGALAAAVPLLIFFGITIYKIKRKHVHTSFISNEGVAVLFGVVQTLVHDLKTRLSSMRLELRNHKIELEGDHSDRQKLLLHADNFDNDINDMLESAARALKITKLGRPNLQEADLNDMLREITKRYRRTLPEHVEFSEKYDSDISRFSFDPEQLRMVIENIISNSIRAVGDSGLIELCTSLLEEVTESSEIRPVAEIEISDSGPGFPSSMVSGLRDTSPTAGIANGGLGLLIAQKIITDHGGRLQLKNREKIGTLVTIGLPMKKDS